MAVSLQLGLGPLEEPVFVRFQLADGVQLAGTMTEWDATGFDGSFGRRQWLELAPRDAWRLYVLVMDQNSPVQWVDLGAALLKVHDGGAWAERAFRRGLELDAAVAEKIETARTAARAAEQKQVEQERTIEQQKLRTSSPEVGTRP